MDGHKKLYVLVLLSFLATCEAEFGYLIWPEEGTQPEVLMTDTEEELPDDAIRATFKNRINSTGWAFFELQTPNSVPDMMKAFGAGFIEGIMTKDLIWLQYRNMIEKYCTNKTKYCADLEKFIKSNFDYVYSLYSQEDPFSYQLVLLYKQMEGLIDGYNYVTKDPAQKITGMNFFLLNIMGDLIDLEAKLNSDFDFEDLLFPDHCSGLVKLLPDLSELYTSHVTWFEYTSMLRMQKKVSLFYSTSLKNPEIIPGHTMSYTSYPGSIQSLDDFYIMSSGLVAAETTIGNYNKQRFKYIKPETILEFARSLIAHRLAHNGIEWEKTFQLHNSGTYNNQWYIVDYNKFKRATEESPGRIEDGLLRVIEQIPGYCRGEDLTPLLRAQWYFPSYNIPYYTDVYNMSGWNERVKLYGDWFGYHTNPRAKIFKKLQGNIKDLESMMLTMRYNDYKHDPDSACAKCNPPYSAANAISDRGDLNPANGTYPFRKLGHRLHGSTDAKITCSRMIAEYKFYSVAGPTYNTSRDVPPFKWSTFDMGDQLPHFGHPDEWTFSPLVHEWEF